MRNNWTRPETLAALHLYLELPYGQLHKGNQKIQHLAQCIGRSPSALALKLCNLASLDSVVIASGRKGMSNVSSLDTLLWREREENWDDIALEALASFESYIYGHVLPQNEHIEVTKPTDFTGHSYLTMTRVRTNQHLFRKAILVGYDSTCCISGLRGDKLLIASHIIPWAYDTKNRLNPANGLCLSALHDRAYDQGLITVLPDHTIRVSTKLKTWQKDGFMQEALLRFDGESINLPERLAPKPEFLAWHSKTHGFMG